MRKRRTLWAVEYRDEDSRAWHLHCGAYQNYKRKDALGEIEMLQQSGETEPGQAFRVVRYEPAR